MGMDGQMLSSVPQIIRLARPSKVVLGFGMDRPAQQASVQPGIGMQRENRLMTSLALQYLRQVMLMVMAMLM